MSNPMRYVHIQIADTKLSRNVDVYFDGKFHDLTKAYNVGILKKEDIIKIKEEMINE